MASIPTLVLAARHVTTLREHLFQPDELERCAFLYCTPVPEEMPDRVLVAEVHPVPDDEMQYQSQTTCRPDPDVELEHLNRCTRQDYVPMLAHSHPFSDRAAFSEQDYYVFDRYKRWLHDQDADTIDIGFAAISLQELTGTVLMDDFTPLHMDVTGDWTLAPEFTETPRLWNLCCPPALDDETPPVNRKRFDRQLRAFGDQGQRRLQHTHAAVIGVGGLGWSIAQQLASIGIGHLTLIDPDDIIESNRPRLRGARPGDVGYPKVRILQELCVAANPDVDITTVYTPVEEAATQLQDVDILLAGVDQLSPRVWVNEFGVRHLLPYIDAGTRIELDGDQEELVAMEGFVQTIAPGATACFECLDRADPDTLAREQLSQTELEAKVEQGYISETALSPAPAVTHLNEVVASVAVGACVKIVTGYDAPPGLVRYDHLCDEQTSVTTHPAATCSVCSPDGVLGHGPMETAADVFTALDETLPESTVTAKEAATDRTEQGWRTQLPAAVTAFFDRFNVPEGRDDAA